MELASRGLRTSFVIFYWGFIGFYRVFWLRTSDVFFCCHFLNSPGQFWAFGARPRRHFFLRQLFFFFNQRLKACKMVQHIGDGSLGIQIPFKKLVITRFLGMPSDEKVFGSLG